MVNLSSLILQSEVGCWEYMSGDEGGDVSKLELVSLLCRAMLIINIGVMAIDQSTETLNSKI